MVSTRRGLKKQHAEGAEGAAPPANEDTRVEQLTQNLARMTVGVGRNSYLVVPTGFAVYRNELGAVKNTGHVVAPGKLLDPTKARQALLTGGESRLQVLDTTGKLHSMAIETGQVVKTWETQKDGVTLQQTDMAHAFKGAGHKGPSNIMVGINAKSIHAWDFRTREGAVAHAEAAQSLKGHGYGFTAGKNGFTCVATGGDTGGGYGLVVVGSMDGTIRVYQDGKVHRAAYTWQPVADSITAIDITNDNNWIVATTDSYLLVADLKALSKKPASSPSKHSADKDTQLAGCEGSAHILLRLKASDKGSAPLQHGQFSFVTEDGQVENCIAASCGQHVVFWNFRHVKEAAKPGATNTQVAYRRTAVGQTLDSHCMHAGHLRVHQDAVLVATKDSTLRLAGPSEA